MKKLCVFHPFSFAIFPIIFLFSHNITESPIILQIALLRLGIPILISLGGTFLLWKLLMFFLKDPHKTGILLSAVILMFFSCGHFHNMLSGVWGTSILFTIQGIAIGPYKMYMALWAILFTILIYVLWNTRWPLSRFTGFLNTVSIFLLVFSLFNIVMYGKKKIALFENRNTAYHDSSSIANKAFADFPNIYYIILDEYAAATTLKEVYNYDNQPFLDFLTQKGFYIASKARSNYTFTILSLASSLNMMYVNHLAHQIEIGDNFALSDLLAAIEMVEDNQVVRFLKSKGYKFIHFRSNVPPTERNALADWDVQCDQKLLQDRFINFLIGTTLIEPFFRRIPAASKREIIQCQFAGLSDLSDIESPFFVLAHIMVPHDPYVFGADGEAVSEKDQQEFSKKELYINQLQFTNKALKGVIESILSDSESPPVIILQADHGIRHHHPWETYIREWTRIFHAYYFPPEDHVPVYDSITPVNAFRVILNYYFDTDYAILPDRAFFPAGESYHYQFLDVSSQTQYE